MTVKPSNAARLHSRRATWSRTGVVVAATVAMLASSASAVYASEVEASTPAPKLSLAAAAPAPTNFVASSGRFTFQTSGNEASIIGWNNDSSRRVTIPTYINYGGTDYLVTSIGARVFEGDALTDVTLPSGLKSIGMNTFKSNSLTSISLPDGLKVVGESAFYGNLLTGLVLPDSVNDVHFSAFGYNRLTSLTLSSSLTRIDASTFHANLLTTLVVPDGVTYVAQWAFGGNLLESVTLPASVTKVDPQVFVDNPTLTTVNVGGTGGTLTNVTARGELGSFGPGDVHLVPKCENAASFAATLAGYAVDRTRTVTYETKGHGTAIAPSTPICNTAVAEPAAPAESDWSFNGWFTDADATAAYDFGNPVTASTTLYAGWGPAGMHKVETSKNETHLSVPALGTASATAVCPTGSVATDGSVRLDAVDQDTGTFADAVVTFSGATADGRGWTGTVKSNATGQIQGKVNVVCLETKTTRVDDHAHDLIVSAPVTADQAWTASGTYDVVVPCATGTVPVAPSFAVTGGSATVTGSTRDSGGWKFTLDVVDAADVTVGVRCLSTTTGETNGHTHNLNLTQLTDTFQVGAGQSALASLICEVGGTGLVTSRSLTSGLVSRGIDPQSKATLLRVFNPGSSDASAAFGVWCLGIDIGKTRTAGIAPVVLPTASAPQPKLVTATLKLVSVKAKKAAGGATITVPVAAGSQVKIAAVSKIKGTKIKKGTVLTSGKATGTKATLKVRGKAAKAVLSGKVKTVRVTITTSGVTTTRVVRITR